MTALASILIPSNRRPCLLDALESIRRSRAKTPYEVIVVGELPDGCPPPEPPVRFLPCGNPATGPMRNAAAAAAKGDLLLFTDSDCIVDPGWIDRAAASCTPERPVVAGGIRFPEGNVYDCGDNLAIFHAVHVSRKAARAEGRVIGTNNLAVRREVFEAVGGFDPRLCSGEDSEFLHRVAAAGHPIWFDPSFAVLHRSNRRSAENIRGHARWYAEGTAKLLREGMVTGSRWRADRILGALPGGAAFWSAVKATTGVFGIVAFHPPFWRLARAWPWAWWFLYCRRREMFRYMRPAAGDGQP